MPDCHLSSPKIEYKDGYEIASFIVSVHTIKTLMNLEEENQVHSFLAHLYRGVLPIHPDYDIAKIKTTKLDNKEYQITLNIRRGWWFLREFLLLHDNVEVEKRDGAVQITCSNCGTMEFYPADTFPRSQYEVEDSCVRRDSQDSEASERDGAVRT